MTGRTVKLEEVASSNSKSPEVDQGPELAPKILLDELDLGCHASNTHHESQELHAFLGVDVDAIRHETGTDLVPSVAGDDNNLRFEAVHFHADRGRQLNYPVEEGGDERYRDFLDRCIGGDVADSQCFVHSFNYGSIVHVLEEVEALDPVQVGRI